MKEKQPNQKFIVQQLFNDPTPHHIINTRIVNGIFMLMKHADLTNQQRDSLFHLQILVAKKLVRVWQHHQAYLQAQNKLKEQAEKVVYTEQLRELHIDCSDELFLEFDEFLVQVKSTLDYIVNVPKPIIGNNRWTLTTFGKEGKAVTNALNNLPAEMKKQTNGFNTILIENNKIWLEETILARDKINHYIEGGVDYRSFSVFKDTKTNEIRVPLWSPDQTIESFMAICWDNLLKLCESFFALFISLRTDISLITFYHEPEPLDSPRPRWKAIPTPIFQKILKDRKFKSEKIV